MLWTYLAPFGTGVSEKPAGPLTCATGVLKLN